MATLPASLRIAILCAFCGERNRIVRTITEDGPVHCICTGCEARLRVAIHYPQGCWRSARELSMTFSGN